MTICIAVNQGDFVYMAADTRVTFGRPKQFHEDGHIKLYDAGIGLITGSGWSQLLNAVKNRIINEDIQHTNDILNIVKNEQSVIRESNLHGFHDDEMDEHISSSGWFYSYNTLIDGHVKTRMSYVHGSELKNREQGMIKSLQDGQAMIWVDGSINESLVAEYVEELNIFVSKNIYGVEFTKSLTALIQITSRIVSNISDICDGVSNEFYWGFQDSNCVKHIDGPIRGSA